MGTIMTRGRELARREGRGDRRSALIFAPLADPSLLSLAGNASDRSLRTRSLSFPRSTRTSRLALTPSRTVSFPLASTLSREIQLIHLVCLFLQVHTTLLKITGVYASESYDYPTQVGPGRKLDGKRTS